jgi:hypothetical protein
MFILLGCFSIVLLTRPRIQCSRTHPKALPDLQRSDLTRLRHRVPAEPHFGPERPILTEPSDCFFQRTHTLSIHILHESRPRQLFTSLSIPTHRTLTACGLDHVFEFCSCRVSTTSPYCLYTTIPPPCVGSFTAKRYGTLVT